MVFIVKGDQAIDGSSVGQQIRVQICQWPLTLIIWVKKYKLQLTSEEKLQVLEEC